MRINKKDFMKNNIEQKENILGFIRFLHNRGWDIYKVRYSPMAERFDPPSIDCLEDNKLENMLEEFIKTRIL